MIKTSTEVAQEALHKINTASTALTPAVATLQTTINTIRTESSNLLNAVQALPNVSTAAPASTPSKTTIRYINDTLFASNFGSVLVSLVNFSKQTVVDNQIKMEPPKSSILWFAFFFLVFRVKAYLDDNASLTTKEMAVKEKPALAKEKWGKASFVVSLVSWLCYSISGFFVFTNADYSYLFLFFALLFFIFWIIACSIRNERRKKKGLTIELNENHRTYLITNIAYILLTGILLREYLVKFIPIDFIDKILQFIPIGPWTQFFVLILLLGAIVYDFLFSKSLDNIYK